MAIIYKYVMENATIINNVWLRDYQNGPERIKFTFNKQMVSK